MDWYESLLIVIGISLDIFAAMEIQGAMLPEVKKKTLFVVCVLTTALQLAFFFGGYALCYLLTRYGYFTNSFKNGSIIAAFVFATLGIRLVTKAVKREFVDERRRELGAREYLRILLVASTYTIFAGCALGMIGTSPLHIFMMLVVCTVAVVIAGTYTGYRFGFELKTGVYVIGAVLLFAASADMLVSNVFELIG